MSTAEPNEGIGSFLFSVRKSLGSFAAETSIADYGSQAGWELDSWVAEVILPLCCAASGKVWLQRGLKLSVNNTFRDFFVCKKRSKAGHLKHSVVCGAWQRDQWEPWGTAVKCCTLSNGCLAFPSLGFTALMQSGDLHVLVWCCGILVHQGILVVTSDSPKQCFPPFCGIWLLNLCEDIDCPWCTGGWTQAERCRWRNNGLLALIS